MTKEKEKMVELIRCNVCGEKPVLKEDNLGICSQCLAEDKILFNQI